jgi:hypothetical protein
MAIATKKSLNSPDLVRDREISKINVVDIAGGGVRTATFEPASLGYERDKPVVDGREERRPFWRTDGGP